MFVFKLPDLGFLTRAAAKHLAAGAQSSIGSSHASIFSYSRLHRPQDKTFVPSDMRVHVDRRDGTTTWSSAQCGDKGSGDYLRRYGGGQYAISLGTWWSKANLHDAMLKRQAVDPGDPELNFLRDAITELDRRIAVLNSQVTGTGSN